MDWKSVILKFKSGTEKKKRDQWIVLFAAGLLLLLFSASGSGKPAHRKEDLACVWGGFGKDGQNWG